MYIPTVPENVGLSSARLQRIGAAIQGYVDRQEIAGASMLIARGGQIAYCQAVGWADLASQRPMQPDTLARIYSMSKPITAAAILMLYEEGRFQLDDPVARFIPGYANLQVCIGGTPEAPQLAPLERPVTFRHLLTHTSGHVYSSPDGSTVERINWAADRKAEETIPEETLAEWMSRYPDIPLAHQPGAAWTYGYSIDVLGYLVEVISGQPFDVFLRERLFGPLGMEDTGFYVPPEKVERFATNYRLADDGRLEVVDDPATGEYSRPKRFLSGGGGLVSTALDYWRFAQMLCNGGELGGVRLLSRKTIELMAANHLPAALIPFIPSTWPLNVGYGMGLGVRVTMDVAETGLPGSVGSFTWQGAASTDFWVDPQEKLVGIILPQRLPGYYRPALDFRVLAYAALTD